MEAERESLIGYKEFSGGAAILDGHVKPPYLSPISLFD